MLLDDATVEWFARELDATLPELAALAREVMELRREHKIVSSALLDARYEAAIARRAYHHQKSVLQRLIAELLEDIRRAEQHSSPDVSEPKGPDGLT